MSAVHEYRASRSAGLVLGSSLDDQGRDGPAWWVAGVCALSLVVLAAFAGAALWAVWTILGLAWRAFGPG